MKITKSGFVPDNVDIMESLSCYCEIEDGVTLLDIMEIVAAEPELCAFLERYSSCPQIIRYIEEARKPAPANDPNPVEKVVVEWRSGVYKGHLKLYANFIGCGKTDQGKPLRMSLSYSPVNEFSHVPIVLDKQVLLYNLWEHPVKESEKLVAIHEFTLLEVLDCVFDDISFIGLDEREPFIQDMLERIEVVEEFYNDNVHP